MKLSKSSFSLILFPVLHRVAGKDASKQFWKYHNESILKKYKGQLQVGSLDSKKQAAPPTPPATPPPAAQTEKKEIAAPQAESGTVVPMPGKDVKEVAESMDPYGDLVPYADPSWYQSVRKTLSYTLIAVLTCRFSITHLISTSHMLHSGKKCARG